MLQYEQYMNEAMYVWQGVELVFFVNLMFYSFLIVAECSLSLLFRSFNSVIRLFFLVEFCVCVCVLKETLAPRCVYAAFGITEDSVSRHSFVGVFVVVFFWC